MNTDEKAGAGRTGVMRSAVSLTVLAGEPGQADRATVSR